MYIPDLSDTLDRRSIITTPTPLQLSHFTLDTSGVSGFFGGDEAISAMSTVHIYRGRRWLGWYNTPGSFQIARRYGRIANSTLFKGFFPGVRTSAAKLFEFDGWQGPAFRGVRSGTIMGSTGHLASVLMKECASKEGRKIDGRPDGSPVQVTIVQLNTVPSKLVSPERTTSYSALGLACFPIAASCTAFIASAFYHDWFSLPLILWGVLSNGISCWVIGSGRLVFVHPEPAKGAPPGDGILDSGKQFVLLQGHEGAVNSITRGQFLLKFPSEHYDQYIGCCSILLMIQFMAQLFLIPQASLFGQIMFISSLAVSWIYNLILSVHDKENIQRRILLDEIFEKPPMSKYILPTRTAAVVFALCVLQPSNPRKIVDAYLPNDTDVWGAWKNTVLERLENHAEGEFRFTEEDLNGFTDEDERTLLWELFHDAEDAYNGWNDLVATDPGAADVPRRQSRERANGTAPL